MTQEDKELLFKDLCARLPYGVMCNIELDYPLPLQRVYTDKVDGILLDFYKDGKDYQVYLSEVKPYLRPMSSMTEEERKELNNLGYTKIAGELYHYCALNSNNAFYNPERHPYVRMEYVIKLIDWLNAHHFDYRGLIEKGLALEAPEGMYETEKQEN